MKSLGTLCSFRTRANCEGNLRASVAAGASGISTGSGVGSETSKATCGLQSKAVAYQLPRAVSRCPGATISVLIISSSYVWQLRANMAAHDYVRGPARPLTLPGTSASKSGEWSRHENKDKWLSAVRHFRQGNGPSVRYRQAKPS